MGVPKASKHGKHKKGTAVPQDKRHRSQAVKDTARQLLEKLGGLTADSASKSESLTGQEAAAAGKSHKDKSRSSDIRGRRTTKRKQKASVDAGDTARQASDTARDDSSAAKRRKIGKEKRRTPKHEEGLSGGEHPKSMRSLNEGSGKPAAEGKQRQGRGKAAPTDVRSTPAGSNKVSGSKSQPGRQSREESSAWAAGGAKSGKRMKVRHSSHPDECCRRPALELCVTPFPVGSCRSWSTCC